MIEACRSGNTADERSPGEVAFRRYCQSCHRLPEPTLKTDREWPEMVQRYGRKARLTQEQIDLIIDYLVASN
jgi:mono/diheme cytochrome c family protein